MAKSKIARLDAPIRNEVERCFRDGCTIDEIVAKLRELGVADVSRSGVGRWVKNLDEQLKGYREVQEHASAWIAQIGENPHGDVGRLASEILKMVAQRSASEMNANVTPPKAGDVMFLAKAIKDLETGGKANIEREIRIRQLLKEEVAAKVETAQKEVAQVAKSGGLSADAEAKIRAALTGISL